MNNSGDSGNVGGNAQWKVRQRAFCFTLISLVLGLLGIL